MNLSMNNSEFRIPNSEFNKSPLRNDLRSGMISAPDQLFAVETEQVIGSPSASHTLSGVTVTL